jgi:hypothetical protein
VDPTLAIVQRRSIGELIERGVACADRVERK